MDTSLVMARGIGYSLAPLGVYTVPEAAMAELDMGASPLG